MVLPILGSFRFITWMMASYLARSFLDSCWAGNYGACVHLFSLACPIFPWYTSSLCAWLHHRCSLFTRISPPTNDLFCIFRIWGLEFLWPFFSALHSTENYARCRGLSKRFLLATGLLLQFFNCYLQWKGRKKIVNGPVLVAGDFYSIVPCSMQGQKT